MKSQGGCGRSPRCTTMSTPLHWDGSATVSRTVASPARPPSAQEQEPASRSSWRRRTSDRKSRARADDLRHAETPFAPGSFDGRVDDTTVLEPVGHHLPTGNRTFVRWRGVPGSNASWRTSPDCAVHVPCRSRGRPNIAHRKTSCPQVLPQVQRVGDPTKVLHETVSARNGGLDDDCS
jgi:hypothetical protein